MGVLVPEKKQYKLFREDGKRLDGRAVDELRSFKCEIGVLNNANGSAYVEHGGNKIYAGVYGPREVHPRHLARPDRGILRVYYRMATFLFMNEQALHQIEELMKYQRLFLKHSPQHYFWNYILTHK